MQTLQFNGDLNETAAATLAFLNARPLLKLLHWATKVCCLLLCLGFVFKLNGNNATTADIVAVITALAWLLLFRTLHYRLVKFNLKRLKLSEITYKFGFNKKLIQWTIAKHPTQKFKWTSLKLLYRNTNGYIIPLTGFSNRGRFIWLPFHAFKEPQQSEEFLHIAKQHGIKVKPVAG